MWLFEIHQDIKENDAVDKSKHQFSKSKSRITFLFIYIMCNINVLVFALQKCLEDLHSRVQRVCSKAVEEDAAAIQKMRETLKSFKSKANGF